MRQVSGTTVPLFAVSFAGPDIGTALGGDDQGGIILHTVNGGATGPPNSCLAIGSEAFTS